MNYINNKFKGIFFICNFTFLEVFVLKIYETTITQYNRDRTYYVLHKNCFYDKYCFIFRILFQLVIFQKMIDF